MSDFQSFRNAVLEDEDLQEQVISIVNTATAVRRQNLLDRSDSSLREYPVHQLS